VEYDFSTLAVHSSSTKLPPQHPRESGNNLTTLADVNLAKDDYLCLKGTPPDQFDRNCEHMLQGLTQFKQFMLMNDGTMISCNPIK
jgi:hypothetical protein